MDVKQLHRKLVSLKRLANGESCGLYLGIDEIGLEVKITDRTRSGAVYSRAVHIADVEHDALNPAVIELISECRRERIKANREKEENDGRQSESATAQKAAG